MNPIIYIEEGIRQQAEERAKKLAIQQADAKNAEEKAALEKKVEPNAVNLTNFANENYTTDQKIDLLSKAVADLLLQAKGGNE